MYEHQISRCLCSKFHNVCAANQNIRRSITLIKNLKCSRIIKKSSNNIKKCSKNIKMSTYQKFIYIYVCWFSYSAIELFNISNAIVIEILLMIIEFIIIIIKCLFIFYAIIKLCDLQINLIKIENFEFFIQILINHIAINITV